MLRFLLDKFKQTPGPLKEARIIAGDIAEEILDVAEYYLKRAKGGEYDGCSCQSPAPQHSHKEDFSVPRTDSKETAPKAEPVKAKGPARTLEVDDNLVNALDNIQNKKKQEFKILAILWDADQRELGKLSAKAVSEHGEKLGLLIRHENVRKVIRMRLDKHVEIHTEQMGSGSIYKYRISPPGVEYFKSKYLK